MATNQLCWQKWLELILFWILVLEIDLVWMRAQTPTLPNDIVHNDDHLVRNHNNDTHIFKI